MACLLPWYSWDAHGMNFSDSADPLTFDLETWADLRLKMYPVKYFNSHNVNPTKCMVRRWFTPDPLTFLFHEVDVYGNNTLRSCWKFIHPLILPIKTVNEVNIKCLKCSVPLSMRLWTLILHTLDINDLNPQTYGFCVQCECVVSWFVPSTDPAVTSGIYYLQLGSNVTRI